MGLTFDEIEDFNSGVKIYPKDITNHLLLVWACDYIPHSPTAYNDGSDPKKPCDVVVVDVVDLDQVDEETGLLGLVGRGCWWRQGRLIQKLKGRIGKVNPYLARMTKALGPNGAFELVDMGQDPKSVQRANTWYAANQDFAPQFAAPDAAPRAVPDPRPRPEPSALEREAESSLTANQQGAMDRLRRMGAQATQDEEPPF